MSAGIRVSKCGFLTAGYAGRLSHAFGLWAFPPSKVTRSAKKAEFSPTAHSSALFKGCFSRSMPARAVLGGKPRRKYV